MLILNKKESLEKLMEKRLKSHNNHRNRMPTKEEGMYFSSLWDDVLTTKEIDTTLYIVFQDHQKVQMPQYEGL